MFGFPNYSFPLYRNYNRYNRYSLNNPFITSNMRRPVKYINHYQQEKSQIHDNFNNNVSKPNSAGTSSKPADRTPKTEKSSENEFLEIFGIKLYFDDLMIISLLFFLYSEGVNDYYLFITLILLLLT